MPPLKATASQLIKIKNLHYSTLLHDLCQSKTGLAELDTWKLNFSNELKQRHENSPNVNYISKEELLQLVSWKLKKGKFRPTLKKLVMQNSEEDIQTTINETFTLFLASSPKVKNKSSYVELVKKSITMLVKLRGIGPATASLILSLLNKITNTAPPFFSDEAAILVLKADQKLKYSLKEYTEFLEWFYDVNQKFEFNNEDLEHGVWCIEMGKVLRGESYLGVKESHVLPQDLKKESVDSTELQSSKKEQVADEKKAGLDTKRRIDTIDVHGASRSLRAKKRRANV